MLHGKLRRTRFLLAATLLVFIAVFVHWIATRDVAAPLMGQSVSVTGQSVSGDPAAHVPVPPIPSTQVESSTDAPLVGTLRGRVIDAVTHERVREFSLELIEVDVTSAGTQPRVRPFTSENGHFEWAGLPTGKWRLTATAAGYQRFALDELTVSAQKSRPLTLPLHRGYKLLGRVYDRASGSGIASAKIQFQEAYVARFEGRWQSRPHLMSAADGSFKLDDVPLGNLILEIDAPNYVSRRVIATIAEENAPLEVALSTGGMISGYLAAGDGVTRVSGTVGLFNLDQSLDGGSQGTSDNGEFSFNNLAGGRYRITGQIEQAQGLREIVLADGERVENLVLALGLGRSIRGVITGLKPRDFSRLMIEVQRENDLAEPLSGIKVNEHGQYEIQGVQPGKAIVRAHLGISRTLTRTVDVPAGADAILDFHFPPGVRLSGRVTRGAAPVARLYVQAIPIKMRETEWYAAETSVDGTYVLEDLVAGEYEVSARELRRGPITVNADSVLDLQLPDTHLSGLVTERGGMPIVGAEVHVSELGTDEFRRSGYTDHLGGFRVPTIETKDQLVVTVYKPGYELFREQMGFAQTDRAMLIRLDRGAGVSIKVEVPESGELPAILNVTEINNRIAGAMYRFAVTADGTSEIPSALAGATLFIDAPGYDPTAVDDWNGQPLTLRLTAAERTESR